MNSLDLMLQRNKDFAVQQSAAGTLMPSLPQALPNVKAIIIGCADMRVDPADILGIKPGEAVVIRNIGSELSELHWGLFFYLCFKMQERSSSYYERLSRLQKLYVAIRMIDSYTGAEQTRARDLVLAELLQPRIVEGVPTKHS